MEWIFWLVAFAYVVIVLRRFPDLVSPRCPLCSAHLECEKTDTRMHLWGTLACRLAALCVRAVLVLSPAPLSLSAPSTRGEDRTLQPRQAH